MTSASAADGQRGHTHRRPSTLRRRGVGVGGGNTPVMRGTPPLSLCDSALSPPSFDCLLLSGRALCRSPTGEGLRERDET